MKCSRKGCENFHPDHHWGKKRADIEGWFFQKDGSPWCPEHIPSWVEEWRKRKKQ